MSAAGVRLVHESNLPGDSCPFEFSFDRLVALLLLELFPFEKLICEAKMWLYNDVQSPGADKTTIYQNIHQQGRSAECMGELARLTRLLGMRDPWSSSPLQYR